MWRVEGFLVQVALNLKTTTSPTSVEPYTPYTPYKTCKTMQEREPRRSNQLHGHHLSVSYPTQSYAMMKDEKSQNEMYSQVY